jgi:hypothetical protein
MIGTYSATFRVGPYTARMTFNPNTRQLACEWDPHTPPAKSLTRKEIDQYRSGRDALLAEVARAMGNILVIDV